MLYPDLIDIPLEVFGGYTPAVPPSDLPPGAAAVAQDCIFPQGALRNRGGLYNLFPGSPIPANAAVNGLKTYLTPTLAQRLMAWDSLGNLYKENPSGTINLVASRPYQNLFYQSSTLFGREYQAFFNALGGFDIPRQFDDTNWDRVSQVGPGTSPLAVDEPTTAMTIVASATGLVFLTATIAAGTAGLVESGNIVTVTPTSALPLGMQVGDSAQITGAGVAAYNGTWIISALDPNRNFFQYINPTTGLAASGGGTINTGLVQVTTTVAAPNGWGTTGQSMVIAGAGVGGYNATWITRVGLIGGINVVIYVPSAWTLGNSGGGTISNAGNIVAGRHQISVAFLTRQGFITQASVPNFWIAAGSKRVIVSDIPTGPSNVIGRLLLFTPVITPPALTGSFYSLPTGSSQVATSVMLISDNATTTTTLDFTDTILISGFSANYLFTQLELGESAFSGGYNSRLFWLGERNKQQNVVNFTFDGGFSSGNFPRGWTPDPSSSAGGGSGVAAGLSADWGDAYAITGNGTTAIRGLITQSVIQDYLQTPIIAANTAYSVRARIAKTAGLVAGTVHINLLGISGGIAVTAAQAGTTYAEFSAVLTPAIATPGNALVFQVYADGTPTNAKSFIVDSIEIYPTNAPFNYSTARFSHAFNPESYDATTGQLQVRPNDGQQLRAGFPLRNNLYLAKDHYLCYVTDDGVNEPASWGVNEVSATIGICGPNAVDWTEEWAVFAERAGLHICWGSDPVKLTPEIQVDASGTGQVSWQSINWLYGHTVWVRIDRVNKMILVGAPVNGAVTPNVVFMMDYRWLESAEEIAASPLVTYSSFTGKILGHGRGRRWAVWNITSNSMTFAERIDGTVQPLFGNGVANGKVYQQIDCAIQPSDDGVAVNFKYQGYGCPSHMEEQQYQLGSHRKLCGFMTGRAMGSGSLGLSITTARRTTVLRPVTLSLTPQGDFERRLNVHGERFFVTLSTNAVGAWCQIEKLIVSVKKDPTIPIRGSAS